MAICPVRRERSDRAAALGTYPTDSAACVTFASVSGLVLIPFRARETDATETFARFATVLSVGAPSSVGGSGFGMAAETVHYRCVQPTARCQPGQLAVKQQISTLYVERDSEHAGI